MKKIDTIVDAIKALGDGTRLKILQLLSSNNNNLCVNAIACKLKVSQPTVSQHLKILKNAGIVEANRIGFHIHYSINTKTIENIAAQIKSISSITDKNV